MLEAKPIKGTKLPAIFQEIVDHDRMLDDVLAQPVIPFAAHKMVARKRELIRHIERVYFAPPKGETA